MQNVTKNHLYCKIFAKTIKDLAANCLWNEEGNWDKDGEEKKINLK